MQDLIERLERTSLPTWELDSAIARLDDIREAIGDCADNEVPAYTSSIDAALTLVPDGMKFYVDSGTNDLSSNCHACVYSPEIRQMQGGAKNIATPAIALCIAALKARLTTATTETHRDSVAENAEGEVSS